MTNYLQILDFCTEPAILKIILYIKIIFQYAFIIVPIGLILMISIDITKNVISSNENDMPKNLNMSIKRIIFCIAMFFVPTIVNLMMSIVNDSISNLNVDYESCIQNIENIEYYEKMAQAEKEQEENEQQQKIEQAQAKDAEKEIIEQYSTTAESDTTNGTITLDFNDITKISNVNSTTLKSALISYTAKGENFFPYVSTYLSLEKENSVNVFALIGIHAYESGWLTSNLATKCYNFGGVKYANQSGAYNCSDGFAGWSSGNAYLNYYVPWLKTTYLTEGGTYYKGKTIEGISYYYNGSSSSWVSNIKSIANGIYKHASEAS